MSNALFKVPAPYNEPVLEYRPGSPEKLALKVALKALKNTHINNPMIIGGQRIETDNTVTIHPPHEHAHTLGHYHKGEAIHVKAAIQAALNAKSAWENMPWQERAAIFLRAADLLCGPFRAKFNAATMLGQSKNVFQSEIDAVCELADFFRYNVQYMTDIYAQQPFSPKMTWNRLEYRPLEGFIFALTPFNFTSIAANLCCAPAMLGNTIVWKPSDTQIYSAGVVMEILEAAGLPDGVINLIFGDGPMIGDVIFNHPDFAGIHFTGSTKVFQHFWEVIGKNIHKYKSYPRIVGETGGKDFIVAHPSANPDAVAVSMSRGAFEFQGQKCSAASRAYIPQSMWAQVSEKLKADVLDFKMGGVEDFRNFINAVIDERSFDKIASFIDFAKNANDATILVGGNYDKSKGYFIEPTVIVTENPEFKTMCEEIFGPVLTVFVYPDNRFEEVLDIVNQTSPYALTGAIFSNDRAAVDFATNKLRHSAGNFYINDKPTGAVVGQQPFGGSRASGTNDKAGSILNLYRWISPRTIKENFVPPTDYKYPFLSEE